MQKRTVRISSLLRLKQYNYSKLMLSEHRNTDILWKFRQNSSSGYGNLEPDMKALRLRSSESDYVFTGDNKATCSLDEFLSLYSK